MVDRVVDHTHGTRLAAVASSRIGSASRTSHTLLSVPNGGQRGTSSTSSSRTLERSTGRAATVEGCRVPNVRGIAGHASVVDGVKVRSGRTTLA